MQERSDAQPAEVPVDAFEHAKEEWRHGMRTPWMPIIAPTTSTLAQRIRVTRARSRRAAMYTSGATMPAA